MRVSPNGWLQEIVDVLEHRKCLSRDCYHCETERLRCPCDGALDDGCFYCSPDMHARPRVRVGKEVNSMSSDAKYDFAAIEEESLGGAPLLHYEEEGWGAGSRKYVWGRGALRPGMRVVTRFHDKFMVFTVRRDLSVESASAVGFTKYNERLDLWGVTGLVNMRSIKKLLKANQ